MRLFQGVFLASMIASTFLVPVTARAAEPNAQAPSAEESAAGLKGVELLFRPGFGGAPSDSSVRFSPTNNVQFQGDPGLLMKGASPWNNGFSGHFAVGYRFVPFLSGGMRLGARSASGTDLSDGSTDLARIGMDAGIYMRLYPAAFAPSVSKYIDPWFAVGIGYQQDTQSFKRALTTSKGDTLQADVSLDHYAVTVPLTVGVDYRVAKFLSLGPSFELAINNPVAGCVTTSARGFAGSTYCSNSEPGKNFVKAETYVAWNAGLDVKLTF